VLYEYQNSIHGSCDLLVRRTVESLSRRYEQTATGCTESSSNVNDNVEKQQWILNDQLQNGLDALYDLDSLIANIASHIDAIEVDGRKISSDSASAADSMEPKNGRAALDCLARLFMMKGCYDLALKGFLALAVLHGGIELGQIEDEAIRIINHEGPLNIVRSTPYLFVLQMIKNHHLEWCLLDDTTGAGQQLANLRACSPCWAGSSRSFSSRELCFASANIDVIPGWHKGQL
jgi:hypothetical protein